MEGSAPEELEARLAELEQQRADGSISEIGFNLRRNLLITRSEQLARRRAVASHSAPPPPQAPPARRRARKGWLLSADQPLAVERSVSSPTAATSPPQELLASSLVPQPPEPAGPPLQQPEPASPAAQQPEPARPPLQQPVPPSPATQPPSTTSPPSQQPVPAGRPRRPRVWAAVPWVAAVAAAAGVVLVAYHLGTAHAPDPSTPAGAPVKTAPPSGVATSSASPVAGGGIGLGQTKTTSDGGRITLVAYVGDLPSITGAARPTAAGASFSAVELRVCAGSTAPTSVTPYDFVLVEPGGTAVDTLELIGEGQQPELQMAEVPPGQCVTGWLSFAVIAAPASFTDTAAGLTWALG